MVNLDIPAGRALFDKFNFHNTPMTFFLDGDGAEVDWIRDYNPPPELYRDKVDDVLKGKETYKALNAAHARNPSDAAITFKLARKWADHDIGTAVPLFQDVVRLDPAGKAGITRDLNLGVSVPFTEYAEYAIAAASLDSPKYDLIPIRGFLAKYPETQLLKDAYHRLANYFGSRGSKEEADAFFAEYAGKFPEDQRILNVCLTRIVRNKGPLQKGAELVEKIQSAGRPPAAIARTIADFHMLNGDKSNAGYVYGKDFMENQVSSLGYDLIAYADFWLGKGENKDNAVAMAETALRLQPDNAYFVRRAAGFYIQTDQEAKALAIFGPTFAQRIMTDAAALNEYAWFWVSQDKNLESALVTAQKAVELDQGKHYIWDTLGTIQAKMKNWPEAFKAMEKAIGLATGRNKTSYQTKLETMKKDAAKK